MKETRNEKMITAEDLKKSKNTKEFMGSYFKQRLYILSKYWYVFLAMIFLFIIIFFFKLNSGFFLILLGLLVSFMTYKDIPPVSMSYYTIVFGVKGMKIMQYSLSLLLMILGFLFVVSKINLFV